MNDRERLADLRRLSQLILDIRLMTLERSSQARQKSLDQLAELSRPTIATDLNPIIADEVTMRYQLWADQRRSAVNLILAQQTAEWGHARQEASEAFGRNAVIGKLLDTKR